MPRFEYKVVPAPTKGLKGKGVKGAEARFSYAIQELMNGLSGYGWEYLRAETLPSVERSGFTKSTTEWRNVLVFRRLRESDADAFAPELLPPPFAPMAANDLAATSDGDTASETEEKEADITANLSDNGVEDTDTVEGIGPSLELLVEARKDSKSDA